MSQHYAYILLGSNIGERINEINAAKAFIRQTGAIITAESAIYETTAWGDIPQADFLNQVIAIQTTLDPDALMKSLLEIEKRMGRTREQQMGPRTIDLDILYYDQMIYRSEWVIIPHPLLHERRFVLKPLSELIPTYIHPVLHTSNASLLDACRDNLEVKKWQENQVN
jgi:2-amino-4-hydroxy-6-hydroxymethyldihydropteridine diphosphokinase